MDRKKKVLAAIQAYPMLFACFSHYVQAIMDHCATPGNYAIVWAIEELSQDWMHNLEADLQASRRILGIESEEKYAAAFGFDCELSPKTSAPDPQKVEDILSEALFPLTLDTLGCTQITRIAPKWRAGRNQLAQADFTARFRGDCTAIEVKSIRPESWAGDGELLGPGALPYWWGKLFVNDVTRKISQNGRRALLQLENTCQRYKCARKLLAVCVRRVSITCLMTPENYRDELARLMSAFPELDYICIKENAHGRVILYP